MNKEDFLRELSAELADLPDKDREDAIKYYSDYIDDEALLGALNHFLKLCGARGRIYSLWSPDLGQGLVFFYTEDVDAVEKYISENLQDDDNVSVEDMKGDINSYVD